MCQERIETYERTEGSTYRVTRCACNLPTTAPTIAVLQGKFDTVAEEKDHLKKPSDALALEAVSGNVDSPVTSMASMSTSLDPPHPESSPKGKGVYKKYFGSMIHGGLWIELGGRWVFSGETTFPRYED